MNIFPGVSAATGGGSTAVAGSVAEDAATTAGPVITGGVVRTAASPPITFIAGDAVRTTMSSAGSTVNLPYSVPEATWSYAAAAGGILNTTTAVTIKAAAAAGLRNYLTNIQLMSEALTNATEVAVRDGAAGTVLWRTKIGVGGLVNSEITFDVPLRGTAATLLEVVTLTASSAGAVYFNAQGFVAP